MNANEQKQMEFLANPTSSTQFIGCADMHLCMRAQNNQWHVEVY